jgi:hypothetical protein
MPEGAIFVRSLKSFLMLPILEKAASVCQITASRNFGNRVSEICTDCRAPALPLRNSTRGDCKPQSDHCPLSSEDGA